MEMKKRVADVIFETLIEHEITDCFAVVGGGAMHLDNALSLNENMHCHFNHHEQACAMAAEAYARYSGCMCDQRSGSNQYFNGSNGGMGRQCTHDYYFW